MYRDWFSLYVFFWYTLVPLLLHIDAVTVNYSNLFTSLNLFIYYINFRLIYNFLVLKKEIISYNKSLKYA